jgi:hypothetical protein
MRKFTHSDKWNHTFITVERDCVSGTVVAIRYGDMLLPFKDSLINSVIADEKRVDYHNSAEFNNVRMVTNPNIYNNAIQGIVFAEKQVNER